MREDTDTGYIRVPLTLAADAVGEVHAGVAGQKIKLVAFLGSLDADGSVQFKSDTTALTGAMTVGANSPFGIRCDPREPFLVTAAGEALNLVTVAGIFHGSALIYIEG